MDPDLSTPIKQLYQERELEKVNVFYLQKEAEVDSLTVP